MISLFKKLFIKPQKTKYEFSDTDRLRSAVKRKEEEIRQFSLKRKQKYLDRLMDQMEEDALDEDIADLENQLYGEDDSSPDEPSVDRLFYDLIQKKMTAPSQQQNNTVTPTVKQTFSDEQIKAEVKKIPSAVLLELGDYSDNELKSTLKQKYPQADDATIERAIELIRDEVDQ